MVQKKWDISVIICAYADERWDDLIAAIASVQQQTLPATEIIVVIDHNPLLLELVYDNVSGVVVTENTGIRGLSDARNSGIAIATGQIIAFLDDDAVAIPNWLRFLSQAFVDKKVLGAGGAIIPKWPEEKVDWFPEEFLWVVGCTYRGMPQTNEMIRNPIGANMAFRREVFNRVGGFRSEIGRVGSRPVGGEETELCIRAGQCWPEGIFLYCPSAKVIHHVTKKRASWRYFCARCYSEGLSKAFVTKLVGTQDGLASECTYTFNILPQGILRGVVDIYRRKDPSGIERSVAILVGLMMTAAGYLIGMSQRRRAVSYSSVQMPLSLQSNVATSVYDDTIGSLEHIK